MLSRLGLALILPIVSLGVVIGTAGTASAADCNVAHRNHGAGWDVVKTGKKINAGPSSTCADRGTGGGNLRWDLHCWEFSDAGNVFWYGSGSDGTGWVNEANLVFNNNVRNFYNKCSTV